MNESNEIEMDCVLDEELLSNMKGSDNEQGEDIELKSTVVADAETFADPLLELNLVASNFEWLFKDEDILLTEQQLPEVQLKPARSRGKRGRPLGGNGSYVSSSGLTWSMEGSAADQQEEQQLVHHQASGKGPARVVTNAVESWLLLFDEEMLRLLQKILNEQIRKRRARNYAERATDLPELRSWLGLNYLCGVFRNAQFSGPLEELWTLELGNAIFRSTMSLARFEFITDCLSSLSDWNANDAQRLWRKLLINCRSYYAASSWLAVDEVFTLDNLSLSICCDAKTLYMTNALPNRPSLAASKQLMQLICDYKTTGRNVTLSSHFAGFKNCEQLLASNLSSICCLDAAAADYPKNWTGSTLVSGSYRLTKQAELGLLSCGLNRQLNVSQAQLFTSESCKQFQQLAARYSTAFSTSKRLTGDCFLDLLHLMLNIAAFNAWILLRLSAKGDSQMEQRDFQRQLGLFLTQQRLQRRLQRSSTSTSLVMRLQICEILGQCNQKLLTEASREAKQTAGIGELQPNAAKLTEGITLVSRYGEKHRRCKSCARNKRETKARTRCQQCQAHRCGNHLISRCYECTGVSREQLPAGNIKDIV